MKNNLIGVLFLFLSLCAFTMAGYVGKPYFDLVNQGITTTSKVVEIEISGRRTIPRVEFTDVAGNSHDLWLEISFSPFRTFVGDRLTIVYLPSSPSNSVQLKHFWSQYAPSFFFCFLGLMWTVAGLLYGKHLFLPIKRKHRKMVTDAETQSAYVQRAIAKYVEGGKLTAKEKRDPRIQALIGSPLRKMFGFDLISLFSAVLFLGIGALTLSIGVSWRAERVEIAESGYVSQGEVIQQVESMDRNSTTYFYWVEYQSPNGQTYQVLSEGFNSRNTYQLGDVLEVLIPLNSNGNPNEVQLVTKAYYSRPNVIVFIGAAFLFASLLMFALAKSGGELVMPWAKGKSL